MSRKKIEEWKRKVALRNKKRDMQRTWEVLGEKPKRKMTLDGLEFEMKTITATSRKLQAKWTIEDTTEATIMQEMTQHYGRDEN